MTTTEITIKGDAYRVEPGATYVIEIDNPVPRDAIVKLKADFEAATGATCVILSGAHIVPAKP